MRFTTQCYSNRALCTLVIATFDRISLIVSSSRKRCYKGINAHKEHDLRAYCSPRIAVLLVGFVHFSISSCIQCSSQKFETKRLNYNSFYTLLNNEFEMRSVIIFVIGILVNECSRLIRIVVVVANKIYNLKPLRL